MHLAQKIAFYLDLNVFRLTVVMAAGVHSESQKNLTLVGKYLSVLNCLRKEDRKKVVKKRMIDQKRTSGM